jgi:hypothetical protein
MYLEKGGLLIVPTTIVALSFGWDAAYEYKLEIPPKVSAGFGLLAACMSLTIARVN